MRCIRVSATAIGVLGFGVAPCVSTRLAPNGRYIRTATGGPNREGEFAAVTAKQRQLFRTGWMDWMGSHAAHASMR